MAGPVEHEGTVAFVFADQLLGEFGGRVILFVASEAVGTDHHMGDVPEIFLVEQLAPDAQTIFVDIDVFFH